MFSVTMSNGRNVWPPKPGVANECRTTHDFDIHTNLNFDPEHSFAEPLQARSFPAKSVSEIFVSRSVPNHPPRVVEEQNLEVVLQSVADENAALEEVAHLLLHNLEVFG